MTQEKNSAESHPEGHSGYMEIKTGIFCENDFEAYAMLCLADGEEVSTEELENNKRKVEESWKKLKERGSW